MHFGALLTEEYHWFPSQFWPPFPKMVLMVTIIGRNDSELPSTYNKMEVMDVWSRKTLTFWEIFVFLAKWTLTVIFAKFCSESFYRNTDWRVVCKFPEIWPTGISDIVRCLPDKKKTKFRLALSLLILRWSRPKSASANPRKCRSAPDIIQIGSFSAEL